MRKNLLTLICYTGFIFSSYNYGFAQAIQGTPQYQSAMQALAQGNYQEAFDAMTPLIQNGRLRGAAMVEMGKIRQKQAEAEMSYAMNHYNEAVNYLSDGLLSNGVSGAEAPKIYYDLGTIYLEKVNNPLLAMESFKKIIENYPTYMAIDKAYFNLARCEETIGLIEDAAAHYQKVISDYPYSTLVENAQEKVRKISAGTSSANAAIESQEAVAEEKAYTEEGGKAHLELGDMQAESGKYRDASDSYRKAIRDASTQEEGVEAYRKLVSMLDEKQKNYKEAAATIEEMLDTYPDAKGNEEMIYKLGQIYENDMDSMKKKIVDGQVRYRKSDENSRKAIEYYDSVTDKYPDSDVAADAYMHKGKIYEELKEYSEARSQYEQFLRDFPQHKEAQSIKNKLKKIKDY